MRTLKNGEITRCVNGFLGREKTGDGYDYTGRRAREYSWDFCFNYFQENPAPTRDMQFSCLQLGYYLASWGMLRGSSYLFKHTNAGHYQRSIEVIEELNPTMRSIDAHLWSDPATQQILVDAYGQLRGALLPERVSHVTLVTKVMLGVWGNVPAFDSYFQSAFQKLGAGQGKRRPMTQFNADALRTLGRFYTDHATEIDSLTVTCRTREFATLAWTGHQVPRAKIIDMFGFQYAAGQSLS